MTNPIPSLLILINEYDETQKARWDVFATLQREYSREGFEDRNRKVNNDSRILALRNKEREIETTIAQILGLSDTYPFGCTDNGDIYCLDINALKAILLGLNKHFATP